MKENQNDMIKFVTRKVPFYARSDIFPTTEQAKKEQKILQEIEIAREKEISPALQEAKERVRKRQEKLLRITKRHKLSLQIRYSLSA